MKIVIKLCAVLYLVQASNLAMAQDTNWTNLSGDQEWTNNANWSSGANVPGTNFLTNGLLPIANVTTTGVLANRVITDTGGGVDIQTSASLAVAGQILMGNSAGSSTIDVNGILTAVADVVAVGTNFLGVGTLTVGATGTLDANGPWLIAGLNEGSEGTIDVNGGTINVGTGHLTVGWAGTGTVNVNNGGQINVQNNIFQIGPTGGSGTVVINDGAITASGLNNTNGTLTIENAGTFNHSAGFILGANSTITINGAGAFKSTAFTLDDARDRVFGNSGWAFSSAPKITESLGTVTITNTDGTELAGDFDFDGNADGADFLEWQHGHTLNPLSASDLLSWETSYGMVGPAVAGSIAAAVPEPSSALLFGIFCFLGSFASRRRFASLSS